MALALVCPKCKSLLPEKISNPRGKSAPLYLTQSAFCPKCRMEVNGLVLELDERIPGPLNYRKPIAREFDVISSAPLINVLMPLGNTAKVARLILARAALFLLVFLISSDAFAVSLNNPYFLVFASSTFLILAHCVLLALPKVNPLALNVGMFGSFLGMILAALLIIAIPLILAFELLLLTLNPVLFIADIVVILLSVILLAEKKG